MRPIQVLSLSALMLTSLAFAQSDENPCAPGRIDKISMGRCLGIKDNQVDEELNKILTTLNNGFWDKETSIPAMEKAQNAWLEFIKLDCQFQRPNRGGSAWRLGYNACLLRHKRDRLKQLISIQRCGNGCIYQ